jgi:hypothetical protein
MHEMTETPLFEVQLSISAESPSKLVEGELEGAADAVLEAVRAKAAFTALGAVVSLELGQGGISLFCNIAAAGPDELHSKVARILDVMLEAANGFEYQASATQRLDLVPA